MPDEKVRARAAGSGEQTAPRSLPKRALDFVLRAWRPAATVVAVMLALLLGWHVVNGRHGLSVWQQKRVEDRQLRKEIDELQQENGLLRQRVERLKSDPDAISHEAREKLHYAKPNEVIVTLPAEPQTQGQAASK
jgi:cell division protein FtsB